MLPLSDKIYNLLINEGIKEHEIIPVLENIYHDIYTSKYTNIELRNDIYNNIRDIIWFNFERKTNTFNEWGKEYPIFMTSLYDNFIIDDIDLITALKNEIMEIKQKLNFPNIIVYNVKVLIEDIEDNTTLKIFKYDDKTHINKFSECNCTIMNDILQDKRFMIQVNATLNRLIDACDSAIKNKNNLNIKFNY